MTDLILTAMIPPAVGVTYCTVDGTPYRADPVTGTIDAKPQHITELTGRGFTTATAAQVPPGDDLLVDTGYPVTT